MTYSIEAATKNSSALLRRGPYIVAIFQCSDEEAAEIVQALNRKPGDCICGVVGQGEIHDEGCPIYHLQQ